MATIKSYTDIEQSKKLAEILPLDSADMHYARIKDDYELRCWEVYLSPIPKICAFFVENLPCWSLTALLDLMPQHIYDELGCRTFGMAKSWDKCRYQVFYEHKTAYVQKEAETAIDAVFEMIIWLKENKKI